MDTPSCIPPALADKSDVLFGYTQFSSCLFFGMTVEPKKYDVFGLSCPLNCSLVLNYQVEDVLLNWREFNGWRVAIDH